MKTNNTIETLLRDSLMRTELPQAVDDRMEKLFENFRSDLVRHPYLAQNAKAASRRRWFRLKLHYKWVAAFALLFCLPLVTSTGREAATRLISSGMDEIAQIMREIPYLRMQQEGDVEGFWK